MADRGRGDGRRNDRRFLKIRLSQMDNAHPGRSTIGNWLDWAEWPRNPVVVITVVTTGVTMIIRTMAIIIGAAV